MKPSDLFINNRQFFGYLISGLIWTVAGFLVTGHNPQSYTDSWFYLICFVLGSYIIGFSIHGALFSLVTSLDDKISKLLDDKISKPNWRWLCSRDERAENFKLLLEKIKGIIDEKNVFGNYQERVPAQTGDVKYNVSDNELEQYCKRYVLECSSALSLDIIEHEATINFIAGLIPALFALAIGYTVFNWQNLTSAKLILVGVMCAISLWLFISRLPRKRIAEKWLWLEGFMTLRMKTKLGADKAPEKKPDNE